jgi:putative membrane protein
MQGRGYEAIYLSVVGGLGACIISLVTLPLFSLIIPIIYPLLRPNTHWLLIFVASYMIFSEKKSFFALITFLLAGLLGIFSLNHIDSAALFPLLTGLFALPILRSSYKQKVVLPDKISFQVEHLSKKFLLYSASIGSLAGILAGLLPGIGSSQAAVLAQEAINTKENKKSTRSFLMSLGGINTADIIYSLFAILLIGKARSGVAIAVNEIIQLTFNDIFLLCGVILISSIVSAAITLKISRIAILNIRKINYIKLSRSVFYFLWLLILLFSGISGILIALPAMLIGFLPQKLGIRRTHLMGCLMIPTILYFL